MSEFKWKDESKCDKCKVDIRKGVIDEVKEVCKGCKRLKRIDKDKHKKNPKGQGYSKVK